MRNQSIKAALVTGASSGIGRASAIRLAQEGIFIAMTGRNRTELEHTAEAVEKTGSRSRIIPGDLTRENHARDCIHQTVQHFERLDILVNAAGIIANGTVENTSLAEWDEMLNINLRSVF